MHALLEGSETLFRLRIRNSRFWIRIWLRTFFHPGSYMKSGMQTYLFSCFLWFQEQSLSHSQKDPGSEKIHLGSGSRGQKITIRDLNPQH
jgi:hypothetical protein